MMLLRAPAAQSRIARLLASLPVLLVALACFLPLLGCQTAHFPPINTAEPGWQLHQGQAVWRPRQDAVELAGELALAQHNDGRAVLEFTKTPLALVVAQLRTNAWHINFVPRKLIFSGGGQPPTRFLWLHVPRALRGDALPPALRFQQLGDQRWRLENLKTGESVEGYLANGVAP